MASRMGTPPNARLPRRACGVPNASCSPDQRASGSVAAPSPSGRRRSAPKWSNCRATASWPLRRRGSARGLPAREVDPRHRGRLGGQAPAAADPALGRLALRPGRGLSGALPILLPRRLARGAADHARLRQRRRDPRRPSGLCGQGRRHVGIGRPRRRGHDVRGLLLRRPARRGTPHGQLGGDDPLLRCLGRACAAALHHQVWRCRTAAAPRPRRPRAGAHVRQRTGADSLRGRH